MPARNEVREAGRDAVRGAVRRSRLRQQRLSQSPLQPVPLQPVPLQPVRLQPLPPPPLPPLRLLSPRLLSLFASLPLLLPIAGCSNLDAVRDFSKSAAAVSTYPLAATAYVDSAVTSAPYTLPAAAPVSASPTPAVAPAGNALRLARQQQVATALDLQSVLGDYFSMLARLAGEDPATLATAKALGSDVKSISGGRLDRPTVDAYANLSRTLGEFATQPARERAVKELVRTGGPDAMSILEALRSVAADWQAQVANDARQVDDTLGIAVMPRDVPPLLRILANDRKAELAREYAVTLRKMTAIDRSLNSIEQAHADMALHLDDLQSDVVRARLHGAAAELRAAGASWPPSLR